jgi:hypothetical protein
VRGRRHGLPTESQELLLKAALLEDGDAAAAAWRRWRETHAISHTDEDSGRVMPLACRNLLALNAHDPELETLKSVYRHQWVANHHRLHRAGAALGVLEGAGIETMVLKGAALAERRYGDIGVRVMYDVDVLVRAERAREAAHALCSSGWRQDPPLDLETVLPVVNGTLFVDREEAGVDLHWHALWSPAVEEDFWQAAEPVEVGGVTTLAQCAADQLLQACVHGIWSDGLRVRWVADAVVLMRSEPGMNWDRVADRARARSLTLPLREALGYLRGTFHMPVPPAVLSALERTRCGVAERAGHRAWMSRQSRRRAAWLVLDRYRRQRALPPGPTRRGSLPDYLRCHTAMIWGLDPQEALAPEIVRRLLPRGSRFAPERP